MNRRTTGMVTGTTIAFVLTWPTVAVFAQAPETDSVKYRSITYPQIYCSADGETHFQDVTVPLRLAPTNADTNYRSTINPAQTSLWVVFPKGWGVDLFRQGVFHTYAGPKRFVSVREGTVTIRVTDGEERTFKKGDIFEAVDLAPCKGRLSKSEDGAVTLLTNHP